MPTSLPQLFGEIRVEKVHSVTVLGLEGGSKEASKVESKLSAHPLVSSFPSSGPISNNSREIVGEAQILSCQGESPSEIRVGHLKFVLVDINILFSSSCITYNGRAMMQDWLVAIHQKLYFLPAGVASSPAGIGQDIDRQRTGGGAEVKAENSVLNGCPASRYVHAVDFYTKRKPSS